MTTVNAIIYLLNTFDKNESFLPIFVFISMVRHVSYFPKCKKETEIKKQVNRQILLQNEAIY